jgi:hypothetical protein
LKKLVRKLFLVFSTTPKSGLGLWVLDKDHYETYAVDSPGMRKHLEGLYYQETKRNTGQGEAIPDQLLKQTLNRLRVMAIHDGEEKKEQQGDPLSLRG